MFNSTYIPVNVNRPNCTVYSAYKAFPRERLIAAANTLKGDSADGVIFQDGVITFMDDPSIQWTVAEVYLANQALSVAEENDFSFYMVKDNQEIPQLFVSHSFKKSRILVNAFNMNSVLLKKPSLVNKAASIIDKTFDVLYCSRLFTTLRDIENGNAKFLDAVIIYKDTKDELMCVNPLTTLMSEVTTYYDVQVIQEMRALLEDENAQTDKVRLENHRFYRTDSELYKPIREDFAKSLITMYDRLRERKSNYIPFIDENYNTRYFYSTNHRYFVNAATFECIIIKNQYLRTLLDYMSTQSTNSYDQLELAWMLAKTE